VGTQNRHVRNTNQKVVGVRACGVEPGGGLTGTGGCRAGHGAAFVAGAARSAVVYGGGKRWGVENPEPGSVMRCGACVVVWGALAPRCR